MRHDADTRLLIATVGIGIGLFVLDLYLPLGIGNGVLYGGLVILSFLLSSRKGPLITASACSVLTMADVVLSPTIEGVPLWMGVTNRLFSLTAIWLPVLFFLHRRRAEEALQEAYDELEERVCERTQELEQSREDLRALAGRLLTAQEEDRRRISRDLHDDINQRLAMLTMDLRQIEKSPPGDAETLRSTIRSMSSRLTKAIMQMDETTQQNAALVEEATSASQSMKEQAGELMRQVAAFKLTQGGQEFSQRPSPSAHKPSGSVAGSVKKPLFKKPATLSKAESKLELVAPSSGKGRSKDSEFEEF